MTRSGDSDWDDLDLPRAAKSAPTAPSAAPDEPHAPAATAPKPGRSSGSGSPPWGAGKEGDLQRLRALTGAPQAVVKIIGYRRGDGGGAAASLRYIGREGRDRGGDRDGDRHKDLGGAAETGLGEISMETQSGEVLHSREDRARLLAQWADGFSNRHDGRDVMHLMLSFPDGVTPKLAGAIAREALPQMFPGRDFAFGVHADTGHAHIHVLVRMRGPDGRQLRTDRTTLAGWREIVAERARSRDVALEASPRWARGLSEKRERTWERAMRLRGEIPRTHRAAAREVLALIASGAPVETRFEAMMRATAARERAALQGLSWALIAQARTAPIETRGRLLDLAELALARAAALPDPQSRREIMAAITEARSKDANASLGPIDAEAVARAYAESRQTRAAARDQNRLSREPLDRAKDAAAHGLGEATPTNAPRPDHDPSNAKAQAKNLDVGQNQDRDRDRD